MAMIFFGVFVLVILFLAVHLLENYSIKKTNSLIADYYTAKIGNLNQVKDFLELSLRPPRRNRRLGPDYLAVRMHLDEIMSISNYNGSLWKFIFDSIEYTNAVSKNRRGESCDINLLSDEAFLPDVKVQFHRKIIDEILGIDGELKLSYETKGKPHMRYIKSYDFDPDGSIILHADAFLKILDILQDNEANSLI